MNYYKIVTLIVISLLLSACGGGGDNASVSDDASDVTQASSIKRLTQIRIDEGNNGNVETVIDYEYDQDGNLTFVRSDYLNDGDYDNVAVFTYDDQNNRTKEEIWNDDATTLTSEVVKTYDSNGNVLTLDISDYRNGIFSSQIYTYSGSKIATRTIYSSDNIDIRTYLYTGNVLDIHVDFDNDSELDYIKTINYDGRGNIIQKGDYEPDGTLMAGGILTYSYDEYDNVLVRGSSISGVLYRYTYTYDREGNKLTELSQPAGRAATFITYHYN